MPEIERQRLLEDHLVDALAELGAEQRLASRKSALCSRHRRDKHALQHHVAQHVSEVFDTGAAARWQRGHHRVDDLRAHPGDRRGQDPG